MRKRSEDPLFQLRRFSAFATAAWLARPLSKKRSSTLAPYFRFGNMNSSHSLLLLLLACISWLSGCAGPLENVSHTPKYAQMVGREYRLLQDCYVYEYKQEKHKYPFIATPKRTGALPRVVTHDNVGKTINGMRILAALPKGTTFKLADVYRQHVVSSLTSTEYTFVIEVTAPAQAKALKVNASRLTTFFTKEPEFFHDIVEAL